MMKKMRLLRSGLVAVLGMAVIALSTQAVATIKDTRHNLSNWGKYTVKATTENQVCIFCHAPHNADSTQAPLWNHQETTATFTVVSSVHTGGAAEGNSQPTGISKKCLSCHDGTVAIGGVLNGGPIEVGGGTQGANPGTDNRLGSGNPGYLGTNLRTTHYHPISFKYEVAATAANNDLPGTFVTPISAYNKVNMLDRNGKAQCHTCHDPHNDWGDTTLGAGSATGGNDPLWRKDMDCTGDNGSVCGGCHTWARKTGFPDFCPDTDYDN